MKKFNYQPAYKYQNYVQQFVYSTSHQLMNYLRDIQNLIPKDSDELHDITYDLMLTKYALSIISSPGFHDSNEYISDELMLSLYNKVYDLIDMIDSVIVKLNEQYLIQSNPCFDSIYGISALYEMLNWEE